MTFDPAASLASIASISLGHGVQSAHGCHTGAHVWRACAPVRLPVCDVLLWHAEHSR